MTQYMARIIRPPVRTDVEDMRDSFKTVLGDPRARRGPCVKESFGAEAFIAALLNTGTPRPTTFTELPLAKDVTPISEAEFLTRPPVEALYCYYTPLLKDLKGSDTAGIRVFASALLGKPVTWRSGRSTTSESSDGSRTIFLNHADPLANRREFAEVLDSPVNTLTGIVAQYVNIVAVHPFEDGNGRLARAILLFRLARYFNIETCYLPLGISHRLLLRAHVHAMRRVYATNGRDIHLVADAILQMLHVAAELIRLHDRHHIVKPPPMPDFDKIN